MNCRHVNSQCGFLLVELLVAFGVMIFVFPLAFFYISRLTKELKAACLEIELREAANNVKAFLDMSGNVSSWDEPEIYICTDAEGKLSIHPLSTAEEALLSDMDFIAKSYDASSLMLFPKDGCQTLYSPHGGTWMIFPKNQKKTS
jgi:hypothetical protein